MLIVAKKRKKSLGTFHCPLNTRLGMIDRELITDISVTLSDNEIELIETVRYATRDATYIT